MASYLDAQIAGKYKGVPFYVRKETLNNVGQTRIIHTYPKTGVQYLEPMGQEPFNETIDIFFHGENYLNDFEKFKKAMQDPAPGRLFSPSYGIFNSVVAFPASASVDQKSLGQISISVTFAETIDRPAPTEAQTSEQDVSDAAQNSRDELQQQFSYQYVVPATLNNVDTGIFDAESLSNAVKTITGKVREAKSFVNKVDQQIRNSSNYASLLLNPGQPIGFLQSIALSFTNLEGFAVFKRIATIGTDLSNSQNDITAGISPTLSTVVPQTVGDGSLDININLWDTDTFERQNRNDSRVVVINTFRMTGLIGMLESAAASNYTTTDEIDEVIASIEQYYEDLVDNDTTGIIIPEMKTLLDQMKSLTDLVLANKRQQAYTVTEVRLYRPTSSFLLAYELYGEYLKTEEQHAFMSDLIAGLNRSQVAYRLEGIVRVVEIGNGS